MKELYRVFRDSALEIVQHGEIVIVEGGKVVFSTGPDYLAFPARSLLKPFQYLATESGVWDPTVLDRKLLALGSVSATEEQVSQLQKWYETPDMALKVPAGYPMDESHRVHLKDSKKEPHRIFHTCFSKHQMIIEACERKGWPKESYLEKSHPFHNKLNELLEKKLNRSLRETVWVTDGCQLPTPVLPLADMALLYWGFANSPVGSEEVALCQAMRTFPKWVGGPKRIDTQLMEKNPAVVSKEGADGLLAFGLGKTVVTPQGLGVVIKMAAGYLPQQAGYALTPILKKYKLNLPFELPNGFQPGY